MERIRHRGRRGGWDTTGGAGTSPGSPVVPVDHGPARVTHCRQTTGICPNCERRRRLDTRGLIVEHWAGRWRCLGSEQYPEPDEVAPAPAAPWPVAS